MESTVLEQSLHALNRRSTHAKDNHAFATATHLICISTKIITDETKNYFGLQLKSPWLYKLWGATH